jgi:copper chaperone CopZ
MPLCRRRALVALVGVCVSLAAAASAESGRTVRISVKNLSCMMCAGKVKKGLLAEPGVERVEASVPDQRFTLTVQGPGPDDARLRGLVEREGVVIVAIQRD